MLQIVSSAAVMIGALRIKESISLLSSRNVLSRPKLNSHIPFSVFDLMVSNANNTHCSVHVVVGTSDGINFTNLRKSTEC